MYKGVPLGRAHLPSFYQAAHSVRTVETRVGVDRVDVTVLSAADLIRDATVNDRVELMVVGEIGARIRVMEINSPKVKVAVACAIVISPRRQSLTYKQCGVDGLSI
ncbi:hypothetical protein H6P81_011104 [Aristolochia fimbriata]|uniref:Uncharacterized protein n=1 Tax=Aristolochia fimbriata TaxID=158543 RepID=A0AAV7ERA8_ARIFI|nr:hypothetical protein H6P81_011104 [Aristolochia fimbriata]